MTPKYRIAVVDDEIANLESLERILRSDGGEVFLFPDPRQALEFLRATPIDIVLTDLRMRDLSGMDLLEAVKAQENSMEVIVLTAFGTVEIAVEAMKKGAYDFITKPLQRVQVLRSVHRALEHRQLLNENASLKEELTRSTHQGGVDIIGKSESIRSVMNVVNQAARSQASVLIEGESGTGKGVIAEYLHRTSDYAQGLLVKINCTAIPENLLEAELFGYEPGAFTGANKRKKGRVELAHGGTLFLDEIGIAPLTLQAKLLRFLQEGEFERLGSNETIRVETRVVSATNTNLKAAIRAGQFREDLFYRLNVIHLAVPPLRDRTEDIPLLAKRFLEDSARKNRREVPLLHLDALDALVQYPWPGNIRELQNLMERLVVLNRTGRITTEDLPAEICAEARPRSVTVAIGSSLKQAERLLIDETLKATRGDKKQAARLLGIHQRTIYRHLDSGGAEGEFVEESGLPGAEAAPPSLVE